MPAEIVTDRIRELTNSAGTGDYILEGAFTGFRAFGAVCGDQDTFDYGVTEQGGPRWENGRGRYNASNNSITRIAVQTSSNNGAAVNWGTETKAIFMSFNAASILKLSEESVVNSLLFG